MAVADTLELTDTHIFFLLLEVRIIEDKSEPY